MYAQTHTCQWYISPCLYNRCYYSLLSSRLNSQDTSAPPDGDVTEERRRETLHSCRSGHDDDDRWEIKTILKLFWGNWSPLLLSVKLTHRFFFQSLVKSLERSEVRTKCDEGLGGKFWKKFKGIYSNGYFRSFNMCCHGFKLLIL